MSGEAVTLWPDFSEGRQFMPDLEAESKVAEIGQEKPELQIDHEFKDLIPPLFQDELNALRADLSTHGCRDRLIIWKGQDILLDGHHRYQICTELGLPFDTLEIELPNRADAKIWIIKNQRGRRNLSESQRAMLAVKLEALYAESAKDRMGTRTDLGQNLDQGQRGRSAGKAGEDMGVSRQSVIHAKNVAKATPELARLVEAGDVAVSSAAKVASQDPETQAQIVERVKAEIEAGKKPKLSAILKELLPPTEDDAEKRMEKVAISLESNLKTLEGISTTLSHENIAKAKDVAQKIIAKLAEIEAKCLDQPSKNVVTASGEQEMNTEEERQEVHSVSFERCEDNEDDAETEHG
jgi:ParB-like chromosome segregation protein Spo0J